MLDAANSVGNLNGVSHDVLVLEDDIEAGDEVPDESLSTEADGDAGEASQSQRGSWIDAHLVQRGEQGDHPNDFAAGAVEDTSDGSGLLLADLSGASRGERGLDEKLGQYTEKVVDDQGNQEDAENLKNDDHPVLGEKRRETGHRLFGGGV